MSPIKFFFFFILTGVASATAADTKTTYAVSVDDVRETKPGPTWDPKAEDVVVRVRGYLRDSVNLYLYSTRDQALLDDVSGVLVSDEGEGKLREDCGDAFVELIARVIWQEKERQPALIPTEAKKLTLRERGPAEVEICWKAVPPNDR